MKRLYFAYGSNLNMAQMQMRCPTSVPVCSAVLRGYRMRLHGIADCETDVRAYCVGALYELQPEDEASLDKYESYPDLYDKLDIEVETPTGQMRAMMYALIAPTFKQPRKGYIETIRQGYRNWRLDESMLDSAVQELTIVYPEEKVD